MKKNVRKSRRNFRRASRQIDGRVEGMKGGIHNQGKANEVIVQRVTTKVSTPLNLLFYVKTKTWTSHDAVAVLRSCGTSSVFNGGCEGLLLHFPSQRYFSSLLFLNISVSTALLRSCHSISKFPNHNSFIFHPVRSRFFCFVWDHHPVTWPSSIQAPAVRQMSSHSPLKYSGIQRSSCLIHWLQGVQTVWLKKQTTQIIISPPPCSIVGMRTFCSDAVFGFL